MKRVHIAQGSAEAHMVKGFLEAAGINASIQHDNLAGASGQLPMTEIAPTVWVADVDFGPASELVVEFFSAEVAVGSTLWRCSQCGEFLEPQFTDCWRCGASRSLTLDSDKENR